MKILRIYLNNNAPGYELTVIMDEKDSEFNKCLLIDPASGSFFKSSRRTAPWPSEREVQLCDLEYAVQALITRVVAPAIMDLPLFVGWITTDEEQD